ncbi:MAG: twin-arginine translocase TatA/TatE family subunit, partial [Actinomycetota bacterium]
MGPLEIGLIALVALLVVGPKRLPELGKTIGKGLREFRKAQEELRRSVDLGLDDEKPARPTYEGKRFTNKRRTPARDTNTEAGEIPGGAGAPVEQALAL